MTRGGLRDWSLSNRLTALAGQILSKHHNPRLWLYCVLTTVIYY